MVEDTFWSIFLDGGSASVASIRFFVDVVMLSQFIRNPSSHLAISLLTVEVEDLSTVESLTSAEGCTFSVAM